MMSLLTSSELFWPLIYGLFSALNVGNRVVTMISNGRAIRWNIGNPMINRDYFSEMGCDTSWVKR
jgi:hypothetical protein